MKIRYVGADDARDLAVAGGLIVCPRMKWVDVTAEAEANGIAPGHAEIVACEVVKQPDWQLESVVKAVRTRAKNRVAAQEDTQVGEQGPEIVELPAGSTVIPQHAQDEDPTQS